MTTSILRDPGRTSASAPAARQTAAGGARSIDLVHLSRQTLGDRALEIELLRLFERQCGQILGKLQKAGAAGERRARQDLAHTLKGSARAVGAGAVADAAERYELELGRSDHGDGAEAALAALTAAAEDARRQAEKLVAEG